MTLDDMTPEQKFFYEKGKISGSIQGFHEACMELKPFIK